MKKINWKDLIMTCIVCLLPILIGVYFYKDLPLEMPIHFNLNNKADVYVAKNIAIFLIPIIMTLLQAFCCTITDINKEKKGHEPKIIFILKWIVPILAIVSYSIMIAKSLGHDIDIRVFLCLVLGMIFVLIGNYLPKMNYDIAKNLLNPRPKNEEAFKKMSRRLGYILVITGIALILSLFLEQIYTGIVILILIIIALIETIYQVFIVKN